jgi:hypothetical protein
MTTTCKSGIAFGAAFVVALAAPASAGILRETEAAPQYEWTCVTGRANFAPRDGAGALVFRDRMWLLGGWHPKDKAAFPLVCNNEVWSSSNGREWRLEKPNTFRPDGFDPSRDWEGRHTAGYAVFKDRLWIVGGDPLQGHYQSDVWSSADGRQWTAVSREVPWGPRVLHYTAAFRGKLWVMGGQTLPPFAPHAEIFYRDIWNSDDGVTWTQVTPREPYWSARGMICGSAVFRGRLWVLGGGLYETPQRPDRRSYNDVWSTEDGVSWTRHLESAPWAARTYHNVAVFDDRLWVLQGFLEQPVGSGNRNDVWHSADGVHWTELPGTPWKPRHASSVFVYGDALWVVAGSNLESDVWKLTRKKGERNVVKNPL